MRLLYIEDDPSFAKLLHAELLAYRSVLWDLVHAVSLDEASARIAEEEFDAVLADLSLPDSEGLATCEQLSRTAPHLPIVVISKTADLAIALTAINLGAQDFIFKGSISGRQVMRRVRFAIERRKVETRQHHVLAIGQLAMSAEQVAARRELVVACAATAGTREGQPAADRPQPPAQYANESEQVFRLLHIEDDPQFARILQQHLTHESSSRFAVEHAQTVELGVQRLTREHFAAILLDMSLAEAEGFDSLHATLPHAGRSPILVLTGHDDESTAVQSIQRGAQDFLVKSEINTPLLERSICLAIARSAKVKAAPVPWLERRQTTFTRPSSFGVEDDRRRHHRYILTKPMSVIPVRSNNLPDVARSGEALALDLSISGVGFQVSDSGRLPSRRWLIGVEADDGQPYFATVEVRNTQTVTEGMRIGARFLTGPQDVLGKANLTPKFDPETGRLATGLPTEVLDQWAGLGIIRPVLLDRIFVCPECRGLPTFGNGCRACGSVQLASCQLIHHFACAHVGYVSEFETGSEVVCPKCRTRRLVVGADFEFLNGPYRCLRCGFSDTELERVGSCLRCELRFPLHQACEEELIGYHVNRLDPLALIDSP